MSSIHAIAYQAPYATIEGRDGYSYRCRVHCGIATLATGVSFPVVPMGDGRYAEYASEEAERAASEPDFSWLTAVA